MIPARDQLPMGCHEKIYNVQVPGWLSTYKKAFKNKVLSFNPYVPLKLLLTVLVIGIRGVTKNNVARVAGTDNNAETMPGEAVGCFTRV